MKKSDMIFENLGYNRINKLHYYKDYDEYTTRHIVFNIDSKYGISFIVYNHDTLRDEDLLTFISIKEIEGINQKIIELRKE